MNKCMKSMHKINATTNLQLNLLLEIMTNNPIHLHNFRCIQMSAMAKLGKLNVIEHLDNLLDLSRPIKLNLI